MLVRKPNEIPTITAQNRRLKLNNLRMHFGCLAVFCGLIQMFCYSSQLTSSASANANVLDIGRENLKSTVTFNFRSSLLNSPNVG